MYGRGAFVYNYEGWSAGQEDAVLDVNSKEDMLFRLQSSIYHYHEWILQLQGDL